MRTVLQFAQQLPALLRSELEQILASLASFWDREHRSDGTHGDVTCLALKVQALTLNAAAGTYRAIDFMSGGSRRWFMDANITAEIGANVGSDFELHRYADNGSFLSTVLAIRRSTGSVGIGTITQTSQLAVVGLSVYANNAAALAGGLVAGDFYRTSTGVLMVTY